MTDSFWYFRRFLKVAMKLKVVEYNSISIYLDARFPTKDSV